jgi:NAD(P)-dependent dehydrogenase (short-subunit alcohol dehydrogenase family)
MSDKPLCVIIGIGPRNGAAFARTFSAAGYRLALLSRSTELSAKLAGELGDARAYACDASDSESIPKVFEAIRHDMGEVDTLVYNAGSGTWGTLDQISAADFERTWKINALGAFVAAQQVVPSMRAQKGGQIVFVGATASTRGKPMTTAFASAKAAQRSLAQSLARHLGPEGIHVSLMILDGRVQIPPDDAARAAPEAIDPADVAAAALMLTRQPRSAWTFELDLRPFVETW